MSPAALVAVLDARLGALAEHLPAALAGDAVGVHQARVASRRLREAVPVAGAALSARRVQKAVRRLRQVTTWLGPIRELDVTLDLLVRFTEEHPDLAGGLEAVRVRVTGAREIHRAHFTARLDPVSVTRLVGRMERFAARATTSDDREAWRGALAGRLATRAAVLRTAVEDAGLLYDAHRLHEVRIAAKKLRYALELAGEARLADTGPLQTRLKRVQDTLGALHDLEVLDTFVQATSAMPGHEDLGGVLAVARDSLHAECRRLHAKYVRARKKLVAVADTARDRLAPQVDAPAVPVAGAFDWSDG